MPGLQPLTQQQDTELHSLAPMMEQEEPGLPEKPRKKRPKGKGIGCPGMNAGTREIRGRILFFLLIVLLFLIFDIFVLAKDTAVLWRIQPCTCSQSSKLLSRETEVQEN